MKGLYIDCKLFDLLRTRSTFEIKNVSIYISQAATADAIKNSSPEFIMIAINSKDEILSDELMIDVQLFCADNHIPLIFVRSSTKEELNIFSKHPHIPVIDKPIKFPQVDEVLQIIKKFHETNEQL